MFVKVLKYIPRLIVGMVAAVILTLLALTVAAASFVGVGLALQGWASDVPTTINAPVQR